MNFSIPNNFQKILIGSVLSSMLCITCMACQQAPEKRSNHADEQKFTQEKRSPRQKQPLPYAGAWYGVKKFVDGDTFWIDDSTATGIKVRLIGIDTPEARNTGKKKKHPMGKEVSQYVQSLLAGKKVRLELDVQSHDQYGRVLAYAFLEDGTHLNAHLLEKGYALLMTVPPNVKYADTFYHLQVMAREKSLGIWAE